MVDGVFNIPLMKGLGYKKEFAAAVEATTSTGGQIMPPVMGAGAFIMAEILGIPYTRVALGAAIPAILFYAGCYFTIHFEAQRINLKPAPVDMIPSFRRKILPKCLPFVLPVSVLVYCLTIGYSPTLAVLYSILISTGWHLITARDRGTLGERLREIISALDVGGRVIIPVAALCACAQIVIGMLSVTGLGVKLSELVISMTQGSVFLTLFFSMIIAIILGMGVPTDRRLCPSSVGSRPHHGHPGSQSFQHPPLHLLLCHHLGNNPAGLRRRVCGCGDCPIQLVEDWVDGGTPRLIRLHSSLHVFLCPHAPSDREPRVHCHQFGNRLYRDRYFFGGGSGFFS